MIVVHFDGAAKLKEKCAYGYVIEKGESILAMSWGRVPCFSEESTCNVAEHYALGMAMQYLITNNLHDQPVVFIGDSKLVISQVFRGWEIKNHKAPYAKYCIENLGMLRLFLNAKGKLVPRRLNKRADRLSKKGMKEY
jgi:ribonuclease HI